MKALHVAGAALALAWAGAAGAHHSFAMFDQKKEVTIVGVVKEYQFANPHIWIQVVVPAKGKTPAAEWSIEGASLNTVKRLGWKRTSITPGDRVTVVLYPMKNGSKGGALKTITLPDGKVLGHTN